MSGLSNDPSVKPRSRLLGLRLKNEVDILALLAFIGSLTALGWQGWHALRGPEVVFAPVHQAVIYLKEVEASTGAKGQAIYVAAAMTLYNLGAPGYGDFVLGQTADLSVGKCRLTFDAQNIVKLGKSAGTPTLPAHIDDWGGVALEHGKAVTRSVEFSALYRQRNQELDCLQVERFIEEVDESGYINIVFAAETTNGTAAQVNCKLSGLDQLGSLLRSRRVAALACG